MSVPSPTPLAYSYLRFSSTAQADGDSVRRQNTLRDNWLKRHPGVRLDTALTLADRGVSGYRGEHRKNRKHALSQFLDLVERGRVPEGSYLIVENLDRLTREEPEASIPLVLSLIRAGVRVVQLTPTEMTYEPGMDFGRLMMMLWELARGHGESKRKSGLCGEAWSAKKQLARTQGTPYGRMCPAWLELVDGKYRIKADAARAVRKVFKWSAEGLGAFGIIGRLNREGVPPIGRSGAWERSYVRKLLTNPAVLGVYQPCTGSKTRVPEGDPVPDYYPAIIDDRLWYAAHAAMKERARRPAGPPKVTTFNPFSGLLWSATDREKLHVCSTRGPKYKYLVSAAAIQKRSGAEWRTFPLRPFVSAVLAFLEELRSADLFDDGQAGGRMAEVAGRLDEVTKRLAIARGRFEADPESPAWADMVSKYDRERRALTAELTELQQAAASPLSASWAEVVNQLANKDPERLRAALLQVVDSIWCLFGRNGLSYFAAVEVFFKGGANRFFLINCRRLRRTADGSSPYRLITYTMKSEPGEPFHDLRTKAGVRHMQRLMRKLVAGDPPPGKPTEYMGQEDE